MLEDQLLLIAGFKHDRVLVERTDPARELYTANEVNGDVVPLFSSRVKERILNVLLRRLGFHLPISFSFWLECCRPSFGKGKLAAGSLCPGLYNTALSPAFQRLSQLNSTPRARFG
jgi:hypothetical protein